MWASQKFKLWATIAGKETDVVQFSSAFELNAIPRGMLVLPVGRRVSDLLPAVSHSITDKVIFQIPAQVWFSGEIGGRDEPVPLFSTGSKPLRIFDGYVTGVGYRKAVNGGASFVMALSHWLADMDFSSALSETSHPRNPAQFSFRAVTPAMCDATTAGGGKGHYVLKTRAQDAITVNTITKDFWGEGIKPWFECLASEDRVNMPEYKKGAQNLDALRALQRFEPSYKQGVPLALDIKDIDNLVIARAIAEDVGQSQNYTLDTFANVTLWGKLIGHFVPSYLFSVSPLVEKALVVPFVPGLREPFNPQGGDFSILARDYDSIDLSGELPRPLRAVGIFTGHGFKSGANLSPDDYWDDASIGGWYESATFNTGLVMLQNGPRWLSEVVVPAAYSRLSAAAAGDIKATALHPDANAPGATVPEPKEIRNSAKAMLDKLARSLYAHEILKGRAGELTGKLRFDIAPGSNVLIEGAAEKFIGASDILGEQIFASVLRVTNVIDAEGQHTATSYRVAHVRRTHENENDDLSIDRHPLWTDKWTGARLIEKSV